MSSKRNIELLVKLGEKIKKIRQEQGISQAQLAFEANIPRNQVGRIERGEINTSIAVLYEISNSLNISLKNLFDFEIDNNKNI